MTLIDVVKLAVSGLLSGTVVAAIASFVLHRYKTRIEEEIKAEFARSRALLETQQGWNTRAVSELLAPLVVHLDRSRSAFDRYRGVPRLDPNEADSEKIAERQDQILVEKTMRDANLMVRDTLLSKAFLIPPDLRDDARLLVEHYDRWLEIYDSKRNRESMSSWEGFIFAGVDRKHAVPFPSASEKKLREVYTQLWSEVFRPETA